VPALVAATLADYVVLGRGNAKEIRDRPVGSCPSTNLAAFRGDFRLWHLADVRTLSEGRPPAPAPKLPERHLI
jgi:hypothetical protein